MGAALALIGCALQREPATARHAWQAPAALRALPARCATAPPSQGPGAPSAHTSRSLPATRVYAPLERVTGFSVGYSCAMGFLGGFTPNICNAIAGALGGGTYFYAGARGVWVQEPRRRRRSGSRRGELRRSRKRR